MVITAVIVVDIRARHDDPEDPVVGAAEAGPAPAMHRRYDPTSIWAYPSRRVLQLRRKGFDLHRAQLEEAAAGARKDGAHLEPIDVRREAGRRRCSSASEGPTSRDAAGAGSPGLARRPVVIDTAGAPFASSEVHRSPRGRARAAGYPAAARDPRPSAPRSSYTAPQPRGPRARQASLAWTSGRGPRSRGSCGRRRSRGWWRRPGGRAGRGPARRGA